MTLFRNVALCGILVLFLSAIVHCEANEYGEPKHPISEDTKMFFIFLKYVKPLNEVDQFVPPHVDFLKKCYEQDAFIFSGPQNPRAGGLILANNDSVEAVWDLIKKDPFYTNEIADFTVVEFIPWMHDDRFACFVNKEKSTSKQFFIDDEKRMFIIDLKYIKPLDEVDALVPPHVAFLKGCYNRREFICSGPKHPRTGGVILANVHSVEEVWALIKTDPFYIHQVAEFTVTEFKPWMHDSRFGCFMMAR
jgi:uncharacterized protein YciI